ncbi:MAG: hypothetical protein ACL93V_09965 [Candidatus Electrothrix sp. YB6]
MGPKKRKRKAKKNDSTRKDSGTESNKRKRTDAVEERPKRVRRKAEIGYTIRSQADIEAQKRLYEEWEKGKRAEWIENVDNSLANAESEYIRAAIEELGKVGTNTLGQLVTMAGDMADQAELNPEPLKNLTLHQLKLAEELLNYGFGGHRLGGTVDGLKWAIPQDQEGERVKERLFREKITDTVGRSLRGEIEKREKQAAAGAGALGFTKSFLTGKDQGNAVIVLDHSNYHEHALSIVQSVGKRPLVDKFKEAQMNKNTEEMASLRKQIQQRWIRKVAFDGTSTDEGHFIGAGTDIVAISVTPDGKITGARPYVVIAGELDKYFENKDKRKALSTLILNFLKDPRQDTQDNWKEIPDEAKYGVRELCTIMLAEKAREKARSKDAEKDDMKLVEHAVKKIAEKGLTYTLVNNAENDAPFAQRGGQKELRERYNGTKKRKQRNTEKIETSKKRARKETAKEGGINDDK